MLTMMLISNVMRILVMLFVLLWKTEGISNHNKHHPGGAQYKPPLPMSTTDVPALLPEIIEPQIPIFFEERFNKNHNRKENNSNLTRIPLQWGDIDTVTVEGFIIPIIKPQGPPVPLPTQGPSDNVQGILEDDLDQSNDMNDMNDIMRSLFSHGSSQRNLKSHDNPVMCGTYDMPVGSGVTIQSPYYPNSYGKNFKCRWILTVPEGEEVIINCNDFRLSKGDYFSAATIGQTHTLTKYTWKKGPVDKMLKGPRIRLIFTSNRRYHQRGFSCSVTSTGSAIVTTPTMAPTTTSSTTSTAITSTTTTSTTTTTTPTTTTTTSNQPSKSSSSTSSTTTTSTSTTPTTTTSSTTTTTTTTSTTTATTTTTTADITTSLPPLSQPDCGIANRNRVVNGQLATPNEYPWQSFLEVEWSDGKNQLCGGSLINKQWVLTAGHCVLRKHSNGDIWLPDVDVTLGMHTRIEPLSNGGFKVKAAEVVIHPEYKFSHDLALIKLPEEVDYRHEVRPICLPNRYLHGRNVTGVLMALIGWGKIETGKLSNELREVGRYGIEAALCKKVFGSYITNHHFCTSGIDEKHICLGDSGGPVMTVDRDRFTLAGVVSFVATADCKGEYPDGHTSVTDFLDWIQDVTGQIIL